jgi:hypothetical protein
VGDAAALAAAGKKIGDKIKSRYNGFDYSDYLPGISGPDAAEAAQAGVESGLSFDPETGIVARRGGRIAPRRSSAGHAQ